MGIDWPSCLFLQMNSHLCDWVFILLFYFLFHYPLPWFLLRLAVCCIYVFLVLFSRPWDASLFTWGISDYFPLILITIPFCLRTVLAARNLISYIAIFLLSLRNFKFLLCFFQWLSTQSKVYCYFSICLWSLFLSTVGF